MQMLSEISSSRIYNQFELPTIIKKKLQWLQVPTAEINIEQRGVHNDTVNYNSNMHCMFPSETDCTNWKKKSRKSENRRKMDRKTILNFAILQFFISSM